MGSKPSSESSSSPPPPSSSSSVASPSPGPSGNKVHPANSTSPPPPAPPAATTAAAAKEKDSHLTTARQSSVPSETLSTANVSASPNESPRHFKEKEKEKEETKPVTAKQKSASINDEKDDGGAHTTPSTKQVTIHPATPAAASSSSSSHSSSISATTSGPPVRTVKKSLFAGRLQIKGADGGHAAGSPLLPTVPTKGGKKTSRAALGLKEQSSDEEDEEDEEEEEHHDKHHHGKEKEKEKELRSALEKKKTPLQQVRATGALGANSNSPAGRTRSLNNDTSLPPVNPAGRTGSFNSASSPRHTPAAAAATSSQPHASDTLSVHNLSDNGGGTASFRNLNGAAAAVAGLHSADDPDAIWVPKGTLPKATIIPRALTKIEIADLDKDPINWSLPILAEFHLDDVWNHYVGKHGAYFRSPQLKQLANDCVTLFEAQYEHKLRLQVQASNKKATKEKDILTEAQIEAVVQKNLAQDLQFMVAGGKTKDERVAGVMKYFISEMATLDKSGKVTKTVFFSKYKHCHTKLFSQASGKKKEGKGDDLDCVIM